MAALSAVRPRGAPSSWRTGPTAGASGSSARPAGWSCPRGRLARSSPGTPMRDANSCSARPDRSSSSRTWRATSARSLASRCLAGAGQHLGQRLGDPVRPCDLEHLLDLAGGPAVRIALDGDDDALPDRRGRRFPAPRGSRRSARTPRACRRRTGGAAASGRRSISCGGSVAARVHSHRHLASSSIATATERHRCLTCAQSASARGPDIGDRRTRPTDADRPAGAPTGWPPIACLDGSPQ